MLTVLAVGVNCYIFIAIIIHSKYFPVSDWLKPHPKFTITNCCQPNLDIIFTILNQRRQKCSLPKNYWTDDVKSATRCRLLNRWPRKPGDKIVLYLVSGKTKSVMAKLLGRYYFAWIIKQLFNSTFVGYEEFCRSRRVLSTSAFGLLWIRASLICWILHILISLIR